MSTLRNIKTPWIIHLFALLHAVVALGCRAAGLEDELLLTMLTMTMALIICLKRGLNVEFTAAGIIVVNILGYMMGNLGARVFQTVISSQYAVHALSTFLTTEVLGWSIVALTKVFNPKRSNTAAIKDSSYLSWLILAMCGIFVFRLCIVFIFSSESFIGKNALEASGIVFSDSFSLITLICINVLYVRYSKHTKKGLGNIGKALIIIAFTLIAALLETCLVGLRFPFGFSEGFKDDILIYFVTALIAQITVYCIVFMINYALSARTEMQEEREKANMAQYRYIKLKHQVNPHFLFNSLNILDCLICEEKTERASTYTHKLAGIYRYMIKSEDEIIVTLRDELEFVRLYVDLLKERFPSGFEVNVDVPETIMGRMVLSCSLQLLIENATKHNAVNPENMLVITLTAADDHISVTNNIVPKMTRSASTGLGQKYIRQMYMDLTGKQIQITKTETSYSVTLPLI